MKRLDKMIDSAINGTFTEMVFDESRLSSLENKFARYLASSEFYTKNMMTEKEKIKTLISDISHQTKIPLSNITLYSELLQEQSLSKEAAQYVSSLISQAGKLKFLITSLVKLSRLETGTLILKPKSASVFSLLTVLKEQYEPAAEEKDLLLSLQEPDVTKNVVFDEKWTQEAIGNILDNAIKYTDSGSITMSVISYQLFTRIDIADTGIGIPEQEQAKIFSRFYRSESVHEKPGIGIGLFLARKILSLENGYIKVSSKNGNGSVFSVYLPNQSFRGNIR